MGLYDSQVSVLWQFAEILRCLFIAGSKRQGSDFCCLLCAVIQRQTAIMLFNQGGAAVYPVTVIAVNNALLQADFRVMDVAANYAVEPSAFGFGYSGLAIAGYR